jgi:hypothetical protein
MDRLARIDIIDAVGVLRDSHGIDNHCFLVEANLRATLTFLGLNTANLAAFWGIVCHGFLSSS